MSSILNARAIMALLQSLQGSHSTGQLLVRSTAATGALAKHAHAIPIVGGGMHEAAILRVEANPDEDDGHWDVTGSGALVTVTSVQGGAHVNLPANTACRWDPPVEGLADASEVWTGGLLGGTRLTDFGSLMQVTFYEDIPSADVMQALFQAQVQDLPAAVLAWAGSLPGHGAVAETLGPNPARLGRGKRLFKHEWHLFLISTRFDSDARRRREGRTLTDDVLELLTDQTAIRGEPLSSPQGIEILGATPFHRSPAAYVDLVRFATSYRLERRRFATYNEWLTSRVRVQTRAQGAPPTKIDVPDVTVGMT